MDTADNGNGRVTLAILGQKVDEVLRRMDEDNRSRREHEQRINVLEQGAATRSQQIKDICEDVDRLESRDTFGSIISGLLAIVAGFIGWFK
mgnify:CR=1 FL=1|jgi:sigma54-dependent transcription regulator